MFIHVDLMSVSSYQVSPILKKIPVCFKVRLLMFKIVSIYIYSCFVVEIRFSSLDSSKLKLCIKRDFFLCSLTVFSYCSVTFISDLFSILTSSAPRSFVYLSCIILFYLVVLWGNIPFYCLMHLSTF